MLMLTMTGFTVKLLFTKFNWTRVVCNVYGGSAVTKLLSDKLEYVCIRAGLFGTDVDDVDLASVWFASSETFDVDRSAFDASAS